MNNKYSCSFYCTFYSKSAHYRPSCVLNKQITHSQSTYVKNFRQFRINISNYLSQFNKYYGIDLLNFQSAFCQMSDL